MKSENSSSGALLETSRLKQFFISQWDALNKNQKASLKKVWGILTYKWRWQIALNIPYMAIFALDRTIPEVHKFDMALLASVVSRLPLPAFIASSLGIS